MLSSHKRWYKHRYHLTYNIYDFGNEYDGDRKTYIRFMKHFLRELMAMIVNDKYVLNLPDNLGIIRIRKFKGKLNSDNWRIDWAKTKELNKKVYHLNMHTNRCYFGWMWLKNKWGMKPTNSPLYHFKPARVAKRHLGKHIKECATDPGKRDYDCLE